MDPSLPVARARLGARALPSWRWAAVAAILIAYVLLTVAIIVRSPVLTLDQLLFDLHLRRDHPGWNPWVGAAVMFGQRGPATLVFLPYFGWVAWRTRSTRPLVMLGAALVLLNVSVGIVKVITGRLGPRQTPNVHDIFVGGDIFPSGHVSNAVVLYGLVAWIALKYRRSALAGAIALCLIVGAATIYLDTHWFSDVVGGWLAGGLVLLVLPSVLPTAQRWFDALVARAARLARLAARRPVSATVAMPAGRTSRSAPAAAPTAARSHLPPSAGARPPATPHTRQPGRSTPVNSAARSHSFAATAASLDARDESTC